MNKFAIVSCVELDKNNNNNGYNGPAIVLSCVADPSLVLFFPIAQDKAEMLNYLIKEGGYGINTETLGLYKTMVDSWVAGNRFLSGIVLDCAYDEELSDEIMSVELALSNSSSGLIETVVPVSFVNAMVLAAMQHLEVIVTMKLINKLLPEEEIESEDDDILEDPQTKFPEDGEILDIVKGIMEGKLSTDNPLESPDNKKTSPKKTTSRKPISKKTNDNSKEPKNPKGPKEDKKD